MKNWSRYILLLLVIACGKSKDHSSPANFSLQYDEQSNIEYLRNLIESKPRNAGNYIRLANIYIENGDFKRAIPILTSGLEELPDNKQIKVLLIKSSIRENQAGLAYEIYDNSDFSSESLEDYAISAEYWFSRQEYTKALDNINRVLVLDDGNSDYYAIKARILINIQDTLGALNNYEEAVKKNSLNYSTTHEYLNLLVATRQYDKFRDIYHTLPETIKGNPRTIFVVSDLLYETDELDSAKNIVFGISHDDFKRQKINRLAKINFKQANYDSVLYYLSGYQLQSTEMLFLEARTYDKTYQYQQAEQSYLSILKNDSTNTIADEELMKLRRKMRYLRDLKRREENRIELIPIKPLVPEN